MYDKKKIAKKMLALLLAAALAIAFNAPMTEASSENIIVAVHGLTPTLNGAFESGEWNDASNITVSITDGASCTVYAKQDGTNLYAGFDIPDSTFNNSDCCILIFDVDHDRNTSLQTDDVWFRISRIGATQEYNVTAGGWFPTTVCGWTAKANSTSTAWQCEYNITYAKLDVTAGGNKTLGVMFLIVDMDVDMGWYAWPSTAGISEPAVWGDMSSNGYSWVPEFSTWISMLLLFTMLTVAIGLYRRRLFERTLH
ncbi:MAG: hypothetical protein OEX77_00625 [Candidatus Bathyarchaeota archaeon]|nr:hypothetical protein [Candidatus Bathyarchaeota archaeon]